MSSGFLTSSTTFPPGIRAFLLVATMAWLAGCATNPKGFQVPRQGDEIIVCGQLFHTGTPVVTWMDPDGYDAYRTERRFSPWSLASWESTRTNAPDIATPNRYGLRAARLTSEEIERVRGGGWELSHLQKVVDQFVIHYDASGTSRNCFRTLHDLRGLSVHFMLDVDGTIYQTLDAKERAWHATSSNSRSVGIEIAHMGAVSPGQRQRLDLWYGRDAGGPRLQFPPWLKDPGVRTPGFVGRPARTEPIEGSIQNQPLIQFDFTPEQYAALGRLTAALCRIFPRLRCDYPRDSSGRPLTGKLPEEQLAGYTGLLGHFHIQENKIDPGPAFQWDKVVDDARRELKRIPESRPSPSR